VASPGIITDELGVSHRLLSAQQLTGIIPTHTRNMKLFPLPMSSALKYKISVTTKC
jgi:hypothetical protein